MMEETEKLTVSMIQEATALYDFVRFSIVDFHGITRCKMVPKSSFERMFRQGIELYSGSIGVGLCDDLEAVPSHHNLTMGNVLCKPQPDTLHPLPCHGQGKHRVGQVFCETYYPSDGSQQTENPRTVLRNQLKELNLLGYQLKCGWEVEYMVTDAQNLKTKFQNTTYCMSGAGMDMYEDIFFEIDTALSKMGIGVEAYQIELDPGQCELALTPTIGMKTADSLICIKDTLKYIHKQRNEKAIFMSRPTPEVSNGFHLNHSLVSRESNKNIFHDYSKENRLSDVCQHWLGGLLRHASAITAFACPTVNCYRRLHKKCTPNQTDWGIDDRMAAFRVKNHSESATYIENRLPSGSSNPYLVIAATVAAGIDGIKNKYELPKQRIDNKSEVPELPRILEEAIMALEKDTYMGGALGEDFINWYATLKRREIQNKYLKDCDPRINDEEMFEKERLCYMDFL